MSKLSYFYPRGPYRCWRSLLIAFMPPKVEDAEYFCHGDPGLINDAFASHTLPETRWVLDA